MLDSLRIPGKGGCGSMVRAGHGVTIALKRRNREKSAGYW